MIDFNKEPETTERCSPNRHTRLMKLKRNLNRKGGTHEVCLIHDLFVNGVCELCSDDLYVARCEMNFCSRCRKEGFL